MKRFYKEASVSQGDGGWQVLLDGRSIRTAAGKPQLLPTRQLAEAMAGEWASQGEKLDPKTFPLRDLADFALDSVSADRATTIAELVRYSEGDTLCYRADAGEPLHQRQIASWEPLLASAEQRWDVHFSRIEGIVHQPQPAETLSRMEAVLVAQSDFTLAALRMMASLAASLVIALAATSEDADAETLWAAANLEEDWQAEQWGRDNEAQVLRQTRLEAFALAMRFAALAKSEG
ncbi:MAG: ATP12 family protein [Novosphingobium sp.]|nr:ATP12 family protein [Novosphingobium sp.]